MMRIVVLGSKPNAVVPPGDAIYCANAAALTNPAAVMDFPSRTVVASGQVIARGLKSSTPDQTLDKIRAQSVCSFDGDEVIFFLSKGDRRFRVLNDELVRCGRPGRAVRFVDSADHRALVREFAGAYPVLDRHFLMQPLGVIGLDAIKIAACRVSWLWGNQKLDVSAKYRPSTGILSLMLAIRKHGPEAQYVLTGVGLGNRDAYILSGKAFEVKRQPKRDLPLHVVADTIVLRRLAQKFNVCTTEVELEGILPIVKL